MTDALAFGEIFPTLSELHGGLGRGALLALTRSPALRPHRQSL